MLNVSSTTANDASNAMVGSVSDESISPSDECEVR